MIFPMRASKYLLGKAKAELAKVIGPNSMVPLSSHGSPPSSMLKRRAGTATALPQKEVRCTHLTGRTVVFLAFARLARFRARETCSKSTTPKELHELTLKTDYICKIYHSNTPGVVWVTDGET